MNNYKIKVNGEDESKEAQELFEVLGYKKGMCSLGNYPAVIVTTQDWATGNYCSTRALGLDIPAHENYKEITMPELRDLVVLKRNDQKDRTHVDSNSYDWYVASDEKHYRHQGSIWVHQPYVDCLDLKPIEKKEMKEYLFKRISGDYKVVDLDCQGWAIEIPEGAIRARFYPDDPDELEFENAFYQWWNGKNKDWVYYEDYASSVEYSRVVWHRPTQPEELPFIDDEPQSLNNQYAEIEQVRQHSHYKKDVSNLEFVDVYRVLKLFDVTDPCLQHAIKKLLCSGRRGAKSSDQDVQEALDSLVRFQQMCIEDTLD